MAGFEVIIYGRFWVIAKDKKPDPTDPAVPKGEGSETALQSGVARID